MFIGRVNPQNASLLRSEMFMLTQQRRDRSRPTKAVTGHRTPKSNNSLQTLGRSSRWSLQKLFSELIH